GRVAAIDLHRVREEPGRKDHRLAEAPRFINQRAVIRDDIIGFDELLGSRLLVGPVPRMQRYFHIEFAAEGFDVLQKSRVRADRNVIRTPPGIIVSWRPENLLAPL